MSATSRAGSSDLFTITAVADALGIHYSTVYRQIDRGVMRCVHRDGARMIERREVERHAIRRGIVVALPDGTVAGRRAREAARILASFDPADRQRIVRAAGGPR